MGIIVHKNGTRGKIKSHNVLAWHSFSNAEYLDFERIGFGTIKVLSEFEIEPLETIGPNFQLNLETILITLNGVMVSANDFDNKNLLKPNDIYIFSAGTGIEHFIVNAHDEKPLRFLKICIIPNKRNVTPRYDYFSMKEVGKKNEFYQILSPYTYGEGSWIYQNVWFYFGIFKKKMSKKYFFNSKKNGVYVFVIDGSVKIENKKLKKGDGIGIWRMNWFSIEINVDSQFLLMEVPMQ